MISTNEALREVGLLSDMAGCHVYAKKEFYGPTGSYKDRITPRIVEEALRQSAKGVVVVSSGNFGLSLAEAAREKGLDCIVLCLTSVLPTYKGDIAGRGASLEYFDSTKHAYDRLAQYQARGYFSASIPFLDRGHRDAPGVDGYEEIAVEIISALDGVPEFIVLPTCYGDGALGIMHGFQKFQSERGGNVPRFALVRTHETSDDIIYSISTDITTPQVAAVLKETNGLSIYIPEDQFVEGREQLRLQCGIDTEVSSGGIIPSLQELAQSEVFSPDDRVVAIFTATRRS